MGYPLGVGLPAVFTSSEGINGRHFVKCGGCWLDVRPASGEKSNGHLKIISVSLAPLGDQAALNSFLNNIEDSGQRR